MTEIVKLGSLVFGVAVIAGVGIWYQRSALAPWLKGSIGVAIILAAFVFRYVVKQYLTGPTP